MGAYENPVTVVDTKSGQIWANAIQTLGNQASKVLDDERDRLLELNKNFAVRLQKIQEQGVKDYDVLSGALSEANINDQQIYDQAQTFQTLKTNASVKLLQTGRPQEELAQAQKEYNEANQALKGLIPYIKSKEESTQDYLNEIGNNPVNVGEQGYASMTENQEFQIGTWIDTGFLKGSKEIIYDKEKGWGTKYKELDDKETGVDNKEFIIWGTQAANYTTTKVPTVDKTLENVLVESGVIDKNGKLTSEYQDIDSEQTRVQKSKNGDITAVIVGPNWEMAALAINDRVDKLAQGYLKDPKTANAVWRNVLGEAEDLKIVKGGAIDPEQSKIFTERLKLRAGNYIPNVDYISSDDPKAKKWVQENPGAFEIKKFGKTTEGSSATEGEIKRAATAKRLKSLTSKLEKLNTKRPTLKGTKKQDIIFDSEFQKELLPEFSFKDIEGDKEGDYLELKSVATGKIAEIPSKGLSDAKLKMTMYILDGGNTYDEAYLKLQKEAEKEGKVQGLPIVFDPFSFIKN